MANDNQFVNQGREEETLTTLMRQINAIESAHGFLGNMNYATFQYESGPGFTWHGGTVDGDGNIWFCEKLLRSMTAQDGDLVKFSVGESTGIDQYNNADPITGDDLSASVTQFIERPVSETSAFFYPAYNRSDGHVYVVGTSVSGGNSHIAMHKYQTDGTYVGLIDPASYAQLATGYRLWAPLNYTTPLINSGYEPVDSIAIDPSGNYYFVESRISPSIDMRVTKFNAAFQLQWTHGAYSTATTPGSGQYRNLLCVSYDEDNARVVITDRGDGTTFGTYRGKVVTLNPATGAITRTLLADTTYMDTPARAYADGRGRTCVMCRNLASGPGSLNIMNVYDSTLTTVPIHSTRATVSWGGGNYDLCYDHTQDDLSTMWVDASHYRRCHVGQTEWFSYTESSKTSLGIPDGGVSIPALDGITSNGGGIVVNHILDIRRALKGVAAHRALTPNGSADPFYKVNSAALGWKDTAPTNFGFDANYVRIDALDWSRLSVDMPGTPTYDVDIGELFHIMDEILNGSYVYFGFFRET